jgi:hypothetical protein
MSSIPNQPAGGGLFNTQPQYYQPQPYYYPQQPNIGTQIGQTIDQFTRQIGNAGNDLSRQINNSANDFQTSMRRMERTWNGEPEYSIPRVASWGLGAAALHAIVDNMSRSGGPTGLIALGVLGLGALGGNWLYDQFMDRFGKQTFGW